MMQRFNFRLFLRVIVKNRELYALKIITLTVALACAAFITLFSIREFGFDRFHNEAGQIFRLVERNTSVKFEGNRNTNRIAPGVFSDFRLIEKDSMLLSRVKVMNEVSIQAGNNRFDDQKVHAADTSITSIFTFIVEAGSMGDFNRGSVILSTSAAEKYYGTQEVVGRTIRLHTFGDTLEYTIAAVYRDFPQNSHEDFNLFVSYHASSIDGLMFDPDDFGVYGRSVLGKLAVHEDFINRNIEALDVRYIIQPLTNIYFGPRVIGEEVRHGDKYSVFIMISITTLILFLTLTGFINFTTLTLPNRVKELAIKKLAGTSQLNLVISFAKESFAVVFISFLLGCILVLLLSGSITPLVPVDFISTRMLDNVVFIAVMATLLLVLGLSPLIMTFRFTRATPNRLLSTVAITFPRFKAVISFLQLGISLFLIVASMIMKRQINFSLVKEPGQNFDQILYVPFPKDFTDEDLRALRISLKNNSANVLDVMATSQLPDNFMSKEVGSPFYFIGVEPDYKDFFDLKMVEGNWFKANDGDSIMVVNEAAFDILHHDTKNVIGVFHDMSGRFNEPVKPVKIRMTSHFNYNFLCIKVLEVDIRKTVEYLKQRLDTKSISFLNKRFEGWLLYQDRLNKVSDVLAIISGLLSCCAIYGLTVSMVRDKLKQIAIRKLLGATTGHITSLLIREFASQLLISILIFTPISYLVIQEMLREFVYHTHFSWIDPLIPLLYCVFVITTICGLQAVRLDRADLSGVLK